MQKAFNPIGRRKITQLFNQFVGQRHHWQYRSNHPLWQKNKGSERRLKGMREKAIEGKKKSTVGGSAVGVGLFLRHNSRTCPVLRAQAAE